MWQIQDLSGNVCGSYHYEQNARLSAKLNSSWMFRVVEAKVDAGTYPTFTISHEKRLYDLIRSRT